ncbi:hypothetical protein HYU18_03930 [Candidatus Woesearchaeota archaeon]|nr:hypothetical protein [Candidatus Woesearchaeota archaeon]
MKVAAAAVAGGLTGVALSLVCLALVLFFPMGFARSYGGSLFHGLDVSSLMVKPQVGVGILLGFVYAFLTGSFIGGVFAAAYNWVEKKWR